MTTNRKTVLALAFLALAAGCTKQKTAPPAETPKQAADEQKAAADERKAAADERKAAADEKKAAADEKKADAPAAPTLTDGYRWEASSSANMRFEVPKDWVTEPNGAVLLVRTPTPGVGIEFVAATNKLAAEKDEKAMMTELLKVLKNIKVKAPMKEVEQHGLKGFVAGGTGEKKGATVDWFTCVLTNGKTAVLAVGFWSPKASDKYKDELKHVLSSIQPGT